MTNSSATLDVEKPEAAAGSVEKTAAEPLNSQGVQERSGVESVDTEKSTLPFSKARCIALVATVTGASFLNVSIPTETARLPLLTLVRLSRPKP